MLRRALLTVAVLSYLICVLLLSGVQKDDFDVNTLRKLQQGNVNIHDVNNEEIPKECRLNNSVARIKAEEMLKVLLSSKSDQLPMEKYNNESLNGFSLQNSTTRIYEDSEQRGTHNDSVIARGRRTVTTQTNFVETTTSLINNDTYKEIVEYTEEKPILKNVIDFWQRLVKSNKKDADENAIVKASSDANIFEITQINNSTPEKNQIEKKLYSKTSLDGDLQKSNIAAGGYLNNMLSEYILNKRTSSETSSPTRRSFDFVTENSVTDDDNDIFKYLLNSSEKKSSETHNINAHLSKYSYEFKFSNIKYPNKKLTYKHRHSSFEEDEDLNNNYVRDFEDLKSISEFVSHKPSTVQYFNTIFRKDVEYDKQRSRDAHDLVEPKFTELRMSNNELSTTTTIQTTLPSEVIKQIAENVRALVLKDLRQDKAKATDLLTTTTVKTKGTTKTTPTYVTKKKLETSYVIEKIMEILQKYKTDNDSNVTYNTEENNERNAFRRTTKVVFPPLLPPIDNYAMKPANYPHYSNTQYKPTESTKKAIKLRLRNPKRKPFNPIRNLPPVVKSVDTVSFYKTIPKTIQTNLNEIPPLGIPVSNPVVLVSQNIIITTRRPPTHHFLFTSKYKSKGNKNTILNKAVRNHNENITDVNQKHADHSDRSQKNLIKFRISDDSDEVNTDYYENERIKNYESRLNNPYRYRMRPRDNIQRYHERLERIQPNSNYDGANRGNGKDEIFKRVQRPINDANKRDDTPFKNLLRTQQKVTDMLERILARTKADQPLIVETL